MENENEHYKKKNYTVAAGLPVHRCCGCGQGECADSFSRGLYNEFFEIGIRDSLQGKGLGIN
jgi:hypothetical protein